jgi:hypothetical protein
LNLLLFTVFVRRRRYGARLYDFFQLTHRLVRYSLVRQSIAPYEHITEPG